MWTAALVDKTKKQIKSQLDQVEKTDGRPARLRFILQQLQDIAEDHDAQARLTSFVLIMSALIYHQRYSGLKSSQRDSLYHKASAILQAQGIEPGRSRLAFLWGEMHQVRSLIERRDGHHWQAAWDQQLSGYLSRPTDFQNTEFQALSYANRALRLGNTHIAQKWFVKATEQGGKTTREQAIIGQIQASRLMGDVQQSEDLLRKYQQATASFSAPAKREFEWEGLRLHHMTTADFGPIVPVVQKKQLFHTATYIIEAFMIAASTPSKEWMGRMRKMRTVARDKHVDTSRRAAEFNFAVTLEECYDVDTPMVIRLRKLGSELATLEKIVNIDKVLLAWAGATRWLVRVHAKPLAALTLREYRNLSMRLSDGKDDDVTRLCRDLLDSDWYCEAAGDMRADVAIPPGYVA